MPLSDRTLLSPYALNPPAAKDVESPRVDLVLENLNVVQLKGVLMQFAALTTFAHDIFSNVHSSASQTFARIKRVSQRTAAIKKEVDDMKEEDLAKKIFSKTENTDAHMEASMFIFQRSSLPKSVLTIYESAYKPPNVAAFDQFLDPPTRCQEKYSNPNFFMEKWIEAEKKRQEEVAEKKRKRREARKAKKKKKEEKEEKKQRIEVASVQKKKYNVLGAEFGADEAPASNFQPKSSTAPLSNMAKISTVDDPDTPGDDKKSLSSSPPKVPTIPPLPSSFPPGPTPSLPPSGPPAPLLRVGSLARVPPPLTQPMNSAPPPPIPPPPVAPAPPSAPVAPIPTISGGGTKSSMGSLELRKVERAPQAPTLLEQIKAGKVLRKVVIEETKAKEDEGTMGEIKKLLDRRKFIEEEEESDEEWE